MVLQWSCVPQQNHDLGMTVPSLLQHNPCHIEQSQSFNGGIGKGGNWGKKQGRDTMLDFAFHFPLSTET